jgi:hypothetical protein
MEGLCGTGETVGLDPLSQGRILMPGHQIGQSA